MTLSKEDIAVIQKTWEIPSSTPREVGVKILVRYFELFPEHQGRFDKFKNVPLVELQETERFKSHAEKIITVFDNTIQALGSDNSDANLQELWHEVGKSHYRRKIPKQYFDDLKGVIFEVLAPICNLTASDGETWGRFFDAIYDVVFKTMDNLAE